MLQQQYLGLDKNILVTNGGSDTAREISGQPELWMDVYKGICSGKTALSEFLNPLLDIRDLRVILTGAGSSAFIGEALQGVFQKATGKIVQAIATTDLVTHPSSFFLRSVPTLMISFARSGNSPESCEAVRLANTHCERIFHIFITCNAQGQLASQATAPNIYACLLPERSNDLGLAMTGSFTSMLLAGALIANLKRIDEFEQPIHILTSHANEMLYEYAPLIKKIAGNIYERVIFLGSGCLLGIARECHLKLQELTDGKVICKHDSFLGFRHGPRAVTNERSLIVYLFSANDHVFQYEKDLAESISINSPNLPVISFGRQIPNLSNELLAIPFQQLSSEKDELSFVLPALLGQLLGFYQSLMFGLKPDNPSVSGSINRVVQGVTIYQ